jgi:hypothetical protein
LEAIVPSLLPCFLTSVRFSDIDRGHVVIDAVAQTSSAMLPAGQIHECEPAFDQSVTMNETAEMSHGESECVSPIEASLRTDEIKT